VAGALGVPVWTILPVTPLFRWGDKGPDTHWYPSMRLFRASQDRTLKDVVQEEIFPAFEKFIAEERDVAAPHTTRPVKSVKKGKTCILLNDTSAWYHWGCTATSEALQRGIESKGYKFSRIRHQAVSQTSMPSPSLPDFDAPGYFMRWRYQNPSLIWEMAHTDIVMINGEGTIHRTAENALKLLYLAYAAKRHLGKQVHIVNHACFPEGNAELKDPAIQTLYKKAYEAADYVAVRDPVSHDILNSMGIRNTLAFDSLPLTVRDKYQPPGKRENRVVLAGSSAFSTQGAIALQQFLLWVKTQNMEAEVLLGARRNPAIDDRAFTETLATIAPGQYKIHEAKSMEEWLDRIATASLLVSGRFHYTIAAACLGTPFVALEGNTPKMAALAETLGVDAPLSYADPKLHIRLIQRSSEALKAGAASEVDRQSLLNRLCGMAEKNFEGL
jgi:polysaccharide pyruvyl transferase WcaK-like protein